jgi:hypothetical protein
VSGERNGRTYIREAQEEQQQYIRGMLAENERLRAAVAGLESDKRHADEQCRVATAELERLRAELEHVASENEQYVTRYRQIEIHNSNLANLYTASYQLHTAIDRVSVLAAIQEIIANLVGSEQVAVFEADSKGAFTLTNAAGLDETRLSRFTLGEGPIASQIRSGKIYVNPGPGQDQITACIPLTLGVSILGAILIFRLLDHKTALQPIDHEIFDLLAVHASSALYCATVREQLAGAAS